MSDDLNQRFIDRQEDGAELDFLLQRIQQQLEAEKERIYQEIKYYPPPIPACDVQYNGLLAERAGIRQEMERVAEILNHQSTSERIELLEQFVQSSHYVKGERLESIRQSLTEFRRSTEPEPSIR